MGDYVVRAEDIRRAIRARGNYESQLPLFDARIKEGRRMLEETVRCVHARRRPSILLKRQTQEYMDRMVWVLMVQPEDATEIGAL